MHFCLQPFFPPKLSFSLFIKSVNLALQIVGKYISETLTSKHTLSIAHKHHPPPSPPPWILWFGDRVHNIPSPKLVQRKSVTHLSKAAWLVGHTNFFCNQTWQGQSVMFSLKLLLLKKLYGSFLWMGFNCLKATKPLRRDSWLFTSRSP